MYKIDQDSDVLFGNLQVQPRKFEPLESGNDSVHLNLSESDSSSKKDGITISTTRWKKRSHGLVSLSEYVENCCSKIINKLMNKVHLRVFALRYFAKDMMFTIVFLSVWKPLPIVVLGEGLTFKHIFFVVLHDL